MNELDRDGYCEELDKSPQQIHIKQMNPKMQPATIFKSVFVVLLVSFHPCLK